MFTNSSQLSQAASLSHKVQTSLSSPSPKRNTSRGHREEAFYNYTYAISFVSFGIIIGYVINHVYDLFAKKDVFDTHNNDLFRYESMKNERNLLVLSNESVYAYKIIKKCLDKFKINEVLLIPFGHDEDCRKHIQNTQQRMWEIGKQCASISGDQRAKKMKKLIKQSKAILIAGGNTFGLLHFLHHYNLVSVLRNVIDNGTLFIGIGAGANILGITIHTCTDIALMMPKSMRALSVLPFQVVARYKDSDNHIYEDQIRTFLKRSKIKSLLGLCSDSHLFVSGNEIQIDGMSKCAAILFRTHNSVKERVAPQGLISSLLFSE